MSYKTVFITMRKNRKNDEDLKKEYKNMKIKNKSKCL